MDKVSPIIPADPEATASAGTSRRRFLLAMAVTAAAAKLTLPVAYAAAPVGVKLTQHDRDDLKRIADSFNQVRRMKARFLQVGPDGSAAEGDVYITPPGRFHFDFDPPCPILHIITRRPSG